MPLDSQLFTDGGDQSHLEAGTRDRAELYRDGDGAGWKGDARFRFVRETRAVARGDALRLWLAGGGGAAVRLVPIGR